MSSFPVLHRGKMLQPGYSVHGRAASFWRWPQSHWANTRALFTVLLLRRNRVHWCQTMEECSWQFPHGKWVGLDAVLKPNCFKTWKLFCCLAYGFSSSTSQTVRPKPQLCVRLTVLRYQCYYFKLLRFLFLYYFTIVGERCWRRSPFSFSPYSCLPHRRTSWVRLQLKDTRRWCWYPWLYLTTSEYSLYTHPMLWRAISRPTRLSTKRWEYAARLELCHNSSQEKDRHDVYIKLV